MLDIIPQTILDEGLLLFALAVLLKFVFNGVDWVSRKIFPADKTSCDTCKLWEIVKRHGEKQDDLRQNTLPQLTNSITALTTNLNSMQSKVDELLDTVKFVWRDRIEELKHRS